MNVRRAKTLVSAALLAAPLLAAAAGAGEPPADEARWRAALATLDASQDIEELKDAMQVLRSSYPASRAMLLETARRGSLVAKCFSIGILGERGDPKVDLEPVCRALSDPAVRVRLAAVMAVRRLGKEGLPALAAYVAGETAPNNRKMAVKAFQVWKDDAAVEPLVALLRIEKDAGVRGFIVVALESLTGRKLGDACDRWEALVDSRKLRREARAIVESKSGKSEGGSP